MSSRTASCPTSRIDLRRPGFEGQEGVALLMAMVAVFLLTVAVLAARSGVDVASLIAVRTAQELQARYLARSGLAIVQAALSEDDVQVDSYSDDWAAANDLGTVPIADAGWAVGQVSDEEGKFNILDLVADGTGVEDLDPMALRFKDLLLILGLPEPRAEEILDSLVDWMDEDGSPRDSGAEDPYYASLADPYSCPNDMVKTIEELALVKGIGPVLLNQGEGEVPPLRGFITVQGERKAGDLLRRINLNTAPKEVLMALSPEINEELAEAIIDHRREEPFQSAADVKDVTGFPGDEFFSNELHFLVDVASSHFSAWVTGETGQASSRAYGVFRRSGGGTVNLVYYRGF